MIFVDGSQLPGNQSSSGKIVIVILAFVGKKLTNISGADRKNFSSHLFSTRNDGVLLKGQMDMLVL